MIETLLLGVKATLLCLAVRLSNRLDLRAVGRRLQSIIVFLVIMPILTSVVVRTFAWIVILGRQGVINQIWLGLGASEPLRLLYSEIGVVIVLAQVQMPLMVLPILTVMSRIDANLFDASRVLGAGEWRTLWRDHDSAVVARRDRGLYFDLHRLHHRIRYADTDRRRAADLYAAGNLSAGRRRE